MSETTGHWSTLRESGTLKGILFLLWIYRVFGRGIFNVVLVFVTAYFFVGLPRARRASREYLNNHYHYFPECWSVPPNWATVFRHLYSFGQAILDKLLAWSANLDETEFVVKNAAEHATFLQGNAGQLIIGSHIGNLEYCRGFMQRYKSRSINALVYDRHSANFVNAMQRLNPTSRVHILQVDQLDIPCMLALKAKIDAGEWLFIAGDRVPLSGEQRTVEVDFLGKRAAMPIGPYMLGKLLQCEVQLMFSYRQGKQVMFDRQTFASRIVLPRGDSEAALQSYAQRYARALEAQCREAPLQWFNFYPYWTRSEA